MRLIDADALEKRFQALLTHIYEKGGNDAALLTVIQMVKSAPTIGCWISIENNESFGKYPLPEPPKEK